MGKGDVFMNLSIQDGLQSLMEELQQYTAPFIFRKTGKKHQILL